MVSDTAKGRPAPSLRERRRLETTADISEAALDLFEARGVDATTVADIAAGAGVSQRTFFRYFPTKESAAYVEDPTYVAVIEEWATRSEKLEDPLGELLDVLHDASLVMGDAGATRRQVRVFRLEAQNPGLKAGRLQGEQAHNDRLEAALRRRSSREYTPYELRTMVRAARALVDSSVEEWLATVADGGHVVLSEIYEKNRRLIGAAMLGQTAHAQS